MPRISTRWQIVGALFAMMMFSSGLGFYNQSVLLEALTRERGLTVFSASLAPTIFFAVSGFAGLGVASVIERVDARWSVAAGVAICAASLVLIGLELAQAGAHHQHSGQRRPTAGAMDDGRTGEVLEPFLGEPTATPGP